MKSNEVIGIDKQNKDITRVNKQENNKRMCKKEETSL